MQSKLEIMNQSKKPNFDSQNESTVLIAEIVGLSELSAQLPSEKLRSLMNECFEFAIKKIELYGGTVSNLDGENIKAVFGVPELLDEAPVKAIGAAVDLIERFKTFNELNEFPNPISLRVGLENGPVIVSLVTTNGQSHFNVFGETVNTASRIRDFAENGQILTGPNLHSKIQKQFEFFAMEPVPVKGQKEPLPIFELIRKKKKEIKSDTTSSRMISSEMVGRQAEFEQLQNGIYDLINGKGSVINIVGKAGIGKSRLMAEIRQKELMRKIALFEGRAISNGKGLSFHPIIRIIKSWARIKEEDSPTDSITKLQRAIRRVYAEAFDEIFPFIATMMGYRLEGKAKDRTKDIEGEALENLILKNLRDLLSRAASIRPVVIVIEDAHWCDISSIIFLESLFKLARKNRILFVNIFRPGHKETGERIGNYLIENLKDHFLGINIEPLQQKQSEELINNLLLQTNLPEEINNLIIERAAGNPFFIEEVIRSFIDEGLIVIKDNNFIHTENIKYANIPESVDNVILSRIDRLDGKTKDLLKTASVIGRNFYFKVLEEAAQTIEEMDNKLEYLKDVQLINERKQKDEVEFLFKHALAQQSTYDSIVEKSRKDLHLKIAGSIEKVFAGRINEFYGMLAHHYSKAGQQEKTEEYLIKAGEESMKSGASSEAVNFLKKALETHLHNNRTPDHQKVVDLEEKLAFAYFASGQYLEAVEYFEKVQAFYMKPFPKSGFRIVIDLIYNSLLILRTIYFYNKPEYNAGTIEKKLMHIFQIKGHALTTIDPKRLFIESFYGFRCMKKNKWGNLAASIMVSFSGMLFFIGILLKSGKKLMDFALRHLDEQFVTGWINGKFTLSMYIFYAGKKFDELEEEKIFNKSLQIGEYWRLATFYVYNGYSAVDSGNEKIVMSYLQRLVTISEVFDNRFPEIQYHRVKTAFYIKFRKMDEAMKMINEALRFAHKTEYKMQLMLYYCLQSMAFSILQDYDNARNSLSEAAILLKDFRIKLCYTHYLIAKSYIEIAELKAKPVNLSAGKLALKTTKDLIKHAQKVRKALPEAYRLRAIVFRILSKPNKALKNFDKSIKAGLSFDGNLELSRTYFEIGKFLRDPKNKKEKLNGMNGTEYLLKAKSMFEEMNLQWDLEEYEKFF